MIEEVSKEMEIIAEQEALLKENSDKYIWYEEATEELYSSLKKELLSMANVGIKIIDNYANIQKN